MQPGILPPKITFDTTGTPGVLAENVSQAYMGMGLLHGLYRPVQTLLIHTAGRGCLAKSIWPKDDLIELDKLVHQLNIPENGARAAKELPDTAALWTDAYLAGVCKGLSQTKTPVEFRLLAAKLVNPDRASLLSGLLVSSYLGLAQGQEHMEKALINALSAGANRTLLETMFSPHLDGWDPKRLSKLGSPEHSMPGTHAARAGSNAWAISGAWTQSGKPLLCGDPHLQINQLPSLFFEMRLRVGDDYWLGATIPGLPGMAVGRNKHVAWSGTFACADNVDFFIECLSDNKVLRPKTLEPLVRREVEVQKRFQKPLRLTFFHSSRGVLTTNPNDNHEALATEWAGMTKPAETLDAYLHLPTAKSAKQAEQFLETAHAYSLHFVLADTSGEVRYCQAGCIPKRASKWSGLYPCSDSQNPIGAWHGFLQGRDLPRSRSHDGMVVTANEARKAFDGRVLSTIPQPRYRLERIQSLLQARTDHDAQSMKRIQSDVYSLQGMALKNLFAKLLSKGPVRQALLDWDGSYAKESTGAHAFEMSYHAALEGLSKELGNDWFLHMLSCSELPVWWAKGFDRVLRNADHWNMDRTKRIQNSLAKIAGKNSSAWGDVQKFTLTHMIFGGLPKCLGFDHGPFALTGSRATICQGQVFRLGKQNMAVGPAYRMIADLNTDTLETTLPGGIDGSRFSKTYTAHVQEWLDKGYHRLTPPEAG